jgi:hypothetical protein
MIMLVSGATKTVRRLQASPHLGVLVVPGNGNGPIGNLPLALDNGAFGGFDERKFLAMLERQREHAERAAWVTCPDVVCDHAATLALFDVWQPRIAAMGFKVAFVAQNGCDVDGVPWDRIACLFIGGDDAYKLSSSPLMREAKRRGKWVHVGRVNSYKRLRWAHAAGADSVDGTSVSMFSERWLPEFLWLLDGLDRQTDLFGAEPGRMGE